ncbi:hypothetical protein C2G38_1402662 [Gigaspora rosea]|uniref:Serine-threonine/tyrosine-protein kinase catalytic domain-containing protein n=1 Tax=Gigaspora rosea TaxID=44941 RepID=A0A397V5R1_9GLOM|nr:hypothetical protein C2G38_1402662 [Gigaspora rosea]
MRTHETHLYLRPHIYEYTAICCADLMKKCWNMEPEKRPTGSEIYDIFTEWRNNENILSELSESDKQLRNKKIEDKQVYNESYYKSRFISFNSDYKYKANFMNWKYQILLINKSNPLGFELTYCI